MDNISLISRAVMTPRVGMVSDALLYLFLAFQIVDQTILPILVITFLFTSAKRLPTLVNVCFTWIFTGIMGSLLLYAGKHRGPEPPKMLCITQAALLDGVPPMTSVAVLTLMYQTHRSIRKPKEKSRPTLVYALIIIPYIVFFSFATTAAILAMDRPDSVTRGRRYFYCSFKTKIFSNVFTVFTAAMLLATKGFILAILIFICRNWRALRQSGSLDIQSLSRVILFGSYVFLAFVLSVLSFVSPRTPIPDLFVASIGTVLALSLATQPDIYRIYFRRQLPAAPKVEHDPDAFVSIDIEKLRKEYEPEDSHMDGRIPRMGVRDGPRAESNSRQ